MWRWQNAVRFRSREFRSVEPSRFAGTTHKRKSNKVSNESNEFPQERVVPGRPESPTHSGTVPVTPDISIEVGDVIEFRLFSARVMAVNIEGYAMLRRTGAFPFVASMRELTDAQIISKRKRRKNTARSRDGE